MNSFIIHDWVNQSLKLWLYILDESSIIQNRWYNKVYSCENKLKDDTVKKLKFTMMDRGLKFSTIHSFQGWDAANVIILLQPEGDGNGYTINSSLNKPEVIYTAITRSKQNIVIINNGNTLYHNFFKRNMINEDYTNK